MIEIGPHLAELLQTIVVAVAVVAGMWIFFWAASK